MIWFVVRNTFLWRALFFYLNCQFFNTNSRTGTATNVGLRFNELKKPFRNEIYKLPFYTLISHSQYAFFMCVSGEVFRHLGFSDFRKTSFTIFILQIYFKLFTYPRYRPTCNKNTVSMIGFFFRLSNAAFRIVLKNDFHINAINNSK